MPTFAGARLEKSNTIMQASVWTPVVFQTERFDVGGYAPDLTKVVAPTAGRYLCQGECTALALGTITGATLWVKRGAGAYTIEAFAWCKDFDPITNPMVRRVFDLAAGDEVKLYGYQNNASNRTLDNTPNHNYLEIWKVS